MSRCERCGGKFDYEGYCETCGSDDEWTWNPPKYNKNKVICKKCGNEIYEVRRHCRYCGAKNEAAFKKGEYYCPCCGIAIEDGHCPNCGKKLEDLLARKIKPIDLRYCTFCGKEISRDDEICLFCGRENYKISERIIWSEEAIHCPDCRKEIWVKDKFCPYCGRENIPKKPEPTEQTRIDSDGKIIPRKIPVEDYHCPGCGRYFDFDGFCWNCAKERFKVSTRRMLPEEATDCPHCKEKISVKDKFCTYCGREINPKKPEPREQVKNDEPVIHAKIPETYKERSYTQGYTYSDLNTTLWLVLGIVSLIICCTPTSIGTIICSFSAKGAENIGDYYTAKRKITAAKIWFFAGAALIVLSMIASVIIQVTTNS